MHYLGDLDFNIFIYMEPEVFEQREFMIFDVIELDKIDFSTVLETSIDTVRVSVDGTKTFVKWDGEPPKCVAELITKQGPFTYDEILEILATPEWNR